MVSGCARRKEGGVAHVGRDEEVVVGEFKVSTISEDRWLAGEDVVGGHLRIRLTG